MDAKKPECQPRKTSPRAVPAASGTIGTVIYEMEVQNVSKFRVQQIMPNAS